MATYLWQQILASNGKFPSLIQEYKQARSDLRKLIKKCISIYELSLASDKKNPKKMYAFVNSKLKSSSTITSIYHNNSVSTDPIIIANTLNQQFQSVFVVEPANPTIPPFSARTSSSLSNTFFSTEIVLKILNKLDPDKSTGTDGISPYVLRHAAAFAPILTLLFIESINQGKMPLFWSEANVTALFKNKGDKLDPGNYRPISITSVPCKILEKLIRNSFTTYLKANNLISPHQHGFVSNKACNTNLLECNDLLT